MPTDLHTYATPRLSAARRRAGVLLCAMAALLPAGCHESPAPAPSEGDGVIEIRVEGVPAGAEADLRVQGPGGYNREVKGDVTLRALPAGSYSIRISQITSGGFTWSALPQQRNVIVSGNDTMHVMVRYSIATGAIALSVDGLPGGVPASVKVTGGGTTRLANGSVVLGNLSPGTWSINIDSLSAGGTSFTGSTSTPTVVVQASTTPVPVTVHYSNILGTFILAASGLPAGDPAFSAFARLEGPLQTDSVYPFDQKLMLPVGAYMVSPVALTGNGRSFTPTSGPAIHILTNAGPDTLRIAYRELTSPLNLSIDNVVISQAVQRPDNSIPLVAGREALLRAFVRADRPTTLSPIARVQIFDGNTALAILLLNPPDPAVSTVPLASDLSSTYYTRIPAAMVRPGLRVLVELDPDNKLGEAVRSDNVWPAGGTARAIATSSVPTFNLRLVPVVLNGDTGSVSEASVERYLSVARNLWPLADISAEVREPFVSSAGLLQPGDANGAWGALLNELQALRALDGAPPDLHYYGVVHAPYGQGIFGLGLVGSPVAVGRDGSDAARVAAHEWGHNFGRMHAPCGDPLPPNADPAYPLPGAATGMVGWDAASNTLRPATLADIMSYCEPAWVSDYSYSAVFNFRQRPVSLRAAAPTEGLLVWGRSTKAGLLLGTPAPIHSPGPTAGFENPQPLSSTTTHLAQLLGPSGELLSELYLSAQTAGDGSSDDSYFAVVMPLPPEAVAKWQSLRVMETRGARRSSVWLRSSVDPPPEN